MGAGVQGCSGFMVSVCTHSHVCEHTHMCSYTLVCTYTHWSCVLDLRLRRSAVIELGSLMTSSSG
jgi:hypothetical protein